MISTAAGKVLLRQAEVMPGCRNNAPRAGFSPRAGTLYFMSFFFRALSKGTVTVMIRKSG